MKFKENKATDNYEIKNTMYKKFNKKYIRCIK